MIIAQARLTLQDPHDCTDANDTLTVFHAVHDTLVRRVGQDFVPHLAASWNVSEDARVWTFRLVPGVRFHDGIACDAEAVRASLERMARADKGYTLGSPGVWRQYLGGAEIAVMDAETLTLTLAAPMADLLDVLEQGFVVSPASFDALDAGDVTAQVGSGPYRIVSAAPDRIEAVAVADHFAGT
ncbi:MAG: ABC transporter substrate-binding protein, partial [Jannaschia sp.]